MLWVLVTANRAPAAFNAGEACSVRRQQILLSAFYPFVLAEKPMFPLRKHDAEDAPSKKGIL
jgi:hypothetical protein